MWFLLSLFFFIRSLFKFFKFIFNCIFNNKIEDHRNSIFFCNISEKFLPKSNNDETILSWYAKNKILKKNFKSFTILKKPFKDEVFLDVEYKKKIIPEINNYRKLIKLIFKILYLFLISFFQLIMFNRWQYVFY